MRIHASARSRAAADPQLRGALRMPACVLAVHERRFYLAAGRLGRQRARP